MASAYQELTAPAKQIRLLELEPGSRDNPIVCKASVAALAKCPTYTALSYCWGKEQEPYEHKITFSGVASFGVTKNLFDALKHLRKEGELTDEPTTLWIDALCINQKDDNEKNMQVKLMGEIYKTAAETCIWLGAAADDSDKAMDAIAALDGDDLDNPRNMVDAITMKAIERLQQRPWWKRVWVIQGKRHQRISPTSQLGRDVAANEQSNRSTSVQVSHREMWRQAPHRSRLCPPGQRKERLE
jgi:hypothetical protein